MRFKSVAEHVRRSLTPTEPMRVEAVADFMCAARTGDVLLYASAGDYFVYGVFVPERLLVGEFVADILAWNMTVPRGFGYSVSFGSDGANPSLCDPMEHTGSSIIDRGTPTVFVRHQAGLPAYVEPSQQLTHVLDLHEAPDRGTWSWINTLGELTPLLRSEMSAGFVCTLEREALDTFLVVSKTCLVRVIDVTRRDWDDPCADLGPPFTDDQREVFFSTHAVGDDLRYLRGFDIVRPSPDTQRRVHLKLQGKEPREYATFRIQDWKHRRVVEWTTDRTPPTKSRSDSARKGCMMSADEGARRSCAAKKVANPASAERGGPRPQRRHGRCARVGAGRPRADDATEQTVRRPSAGG